MNDVAVEAFAAIRLWLAPSPYSETADAEAIPGRRE
jgi:hypothetical protein